MYELKVFQQTVQAYTTQRSTKSSYQPSTTLADKKAKSTPIGKASEVPSFLKALYISGVDESGDTGE